MAPSAQDDKGYFRRKYPRRTFNRWTGVLLSGAYSVYFAGEIGEGGMSLIGDLPLKENKSVVVSFQIPGGDFVSLRGLVRTCQKQEGRFHHGLSFDSIQFTHRRQIRAFVSARTERDEIDL